MGSKQLKRRVRKNKKTKRLSGNSTEATAIERQSQDIQTSPKITVIIYTLLVLYISGFTYVRDYWYPADLFWDENYHIASAYKYLNHVMFMEPHPPLGKLLIALGEYIFHPNNNLYTASFLATDYIKNVPPGFSFVGVRFFPVVFAVLGAIVFFFILYKISKNPHISFLFTSFYLFDNALIVHNRGAMIDGIQIFFILLTFLYFLLLLDVEKLNNRQYFIMGLLVGLAVSVKLNGAILFLIFIPLFFYKQKKFLSGIIIKTFLSKAMLFFSGIAFIFCGVYYIHALLGQQVVAGRYYGASAGYRWILANHQSYNPLYLPIILRDNLVYTSNYEAGVPKYKQNNPHEDGSLPYMWPFGDKTVNYRWETNNRGETVRYLYLVSNPLIWFSGLLGIISAVSLVIATVFFKRSISNKRLFFIIIVLLSLYIIYMYAMFNISRVLYLYHYFIPLLFSLILAFTIYIYIFEKRLEKGDKRLSYTTIVFILFIIIIYFFFSPLTYLQPLTKSQFLMRSWFPFWHMKPV